MFFGEKAPTQEPGVGASPLEGATAERKPSPNAVSSVVEPIQEDTPFPPGIVGWIAQALLERAARPVPELALATAIGIVAGVIGRAYNASGLGLNLYILMLASTGTGKDIASDGRDAMFNAIAKTVPASADFRGAGELPSAAGVIRMFHDAKNPAKLSVLGEFGVKLKEMADPRANTNLAGLERILLQIYTKSGHDKTLDGSAYSDSQKNTKAVASPSLTILAESVPGRFYELVDEAMIASGLLPRFLVFEYHGKRQYDNAHKGKPIPDWLVTNFGALCEQSLNITSRFLVGGAPHSVPFNDEAKAAFAAYDTDITDRMNADQSEVVKQLWNRAHEKALKLAGIVAVGINPFFPVIDLDCFMWATRIVNRQTSALLAKFEAGEVGKFASEEEQQVAEVIKAIALYMNGEFGRVKSYGAEERMHHAKVFTKSFLYRYLSKRAAFRNDRQGANNALTRALKTLEESDEIREVGKPQMNQMFGAGPRAYCVSNPERFLSYHRV